MLRAGDSGPEITGSCSVIAVIRCENSSRCFLAVLEEASTVPFPTGVGAEDNANYKCLGSVDHVEAPTASKRFERSSEV